MGLVKEMQRWAYEIHSSFLVPGAPLAVPNIEHAIVNEIDRYTIFSSIVVIVVVIV